ncbi:DUF72 domain-containing protein [Pendulispora albinea]|uniref:DUF72 domain-containing protein n=1 Tax=Pendulispora albinea TaxID=2741071 RepID=A0ABZ2M8M6_9BACT
MRIFVGTSGYSYKEWRGDFYPEDTPADGFLPYYATRLPTVEINNTFYRFPSTKALEGWASQVPEAFTFALKAPGRITHQKRLKDVGDLVRDLFVNLAILGKKLGPVDFQLPPNFKKDLPRLRDFLAAVPRDAKVAMEFRHPSWFDDEVYATLNEYGVALCIAESDELEAAGAVKDDLQAPLVATARWGYLRLRRSDYGDAELRAWGERVKAQAWEQTHVFIKHEAVQSPLLAVRLAELLSG